MLPSLLLHAILTIKEAIFFACFSCPSVANAFEILFHMNRVLTCLSILSLCTYVLCGSAKTSLNSYFGEFRAAWNTSIFLRIDVRGNYSVKNQAWPKTFRILLKTERLKKQKEGSTQFRFREWFSRWIRFWCGIKRSQAIN